MSKYYQTVLSTVLYIFFRLLDFNSYCLHASPCLLVMGGLAGTELLETKILVLLSASIEIFSASRMPDFYIVKDLKNMVLYYIELFL